MQGFRVWGLGFRVFYQLQACHGRERVADGADGNNHRFAVCSSAESPWCLISREWIMGTIIGDYIGTTIGIPY